MKMRGRTEVPPRDLAKVEVQLPKVVVTAAQLPAAVPMAAPVVLK